MVAIDVGEDGVDGRTRGPGAFAEAHDADGLEGQAGGASERADIEAGLAEPADGKADRVKRLPDGAERGAAGQAEGWVRVSA